MKNNFTLLRTILLAFLSIVFFTSCNKDNTIILAETTTQASAKFFEKGNHPYTSENMAKAWDKLTALNPELTKNLSPNFAVTHNYIKFSPKSDAEYKMLQEVYGIELKANSWLYEKNTGNETAFTLDNNLKNFYAAVPVNKQLPANIQFEILDKMFAPELLEKNNSIVNTLGVNAVNALIDESYALLQNASNSELYSIANPSLQRIGYKPGGKISVKKGSVSVGFDGARVYVNGPDDNDTVFHYCNENGIFGNTGETITHKVRYELKYRLGLTSFSSNVTITGPRLRGDWIQIITFRTDMCIGYGGIFPSGWCIYI